MYHLRETTKSNIKIIIKTYPIFDNFECILFNLGAANTGESTRDQGDGTSDKSYIMKLCEKVFQCYFQELKSNSFAKGASSRNYRYNF